MSFAPVSDTSLTVHVRRQVPSIAMDVGREGAVESDPSCSSLVRYHRAVLSRLAKDGTRGGAPAMRLAMAELTAVQFLPFFLAW